MNGTGHSAFILSDPADIAIDGYYYVVFGPQASLVTQRRRHMFALDIGIEWYLR